MLLRVRYTSCASFVLLGRRRL